MNEQSSVYWVGKSKWELDTPCLAIELDLLDANLAEMHRFVTARAKQLRPHTKTHKCSTLARRQMDVGAVGVCAAKASEAESLIERGVQSVLITGPVATPFKAERVAQCVRQAASCAIVIDSTDGARLLHQALKIQNLKMPVLIDVNVGQERTGINPEEALPLARDISKLATLELQGIQAYAGHVQHMSSFEARRNASLKALQLAVDVFHRLRGAGFSCEIFSGGGTGTYDIDVAVAELTDLQVGSYTLMDAEYRGIGSRQSEEKFETFRPALTLLSSVVSVNQKGFVTVDAGLKAMYRDGAAPLVLGRGGELIYDWSGDEYGRISVAQSVDSAPASLPKLGEGVELMVSHCDPTVNLFDCFYITQNDVVVDVWPIDLRGRSQ